MVSRAATTAGSRALACRRRRSGRTRDDRTRDHPTRDHRTRDDRGNAALELLILAPVILGLIGLVIAAGRTSVAQGSVDAAARDAARQASLAVSPAAAQFAATSTANAALRADGLHCRPVVSVDVAQAFATPLGQPAQVSAYVSCTVSLSDLLVPGIPGSRRLTARFTSPLDPYRAR